MGCESSKERFAACKSLLDHGFANYAAVTPEAVGEQVPVVLGKAPAVSAVPSALVPLIIDKAQKNSVTTEMELEESVEAPVAKGQRLGTLTVKAGEQILAQIPLVAEESVEKKGFWDLFAQMLRRTAMAE
jgi:D-alanyl-D-alanine carboxypeptidase (penicillin-binding protein 5/6)